MSKNSVLIIGANGQIGSVLTAALRKIHGTDNVISSDIRAKPNGDGPFELLDVTDAQQIAQIVDKHKVAQIYHLAAILSAKAEGKPKKAWDINMDGLLNVCEVALEKGVKKVFFPSSIAVFGNNAPKHKTPQSTNLSPNSVYGISKVAGELWCQYFYDHHGLDIRCLRYPGVIGYQSEPGGGTTDYAVDIFHYAVRGEAYNCFLKEDTGLPMIYMDDAIHATIQLMGAPSANLKTRTGYNVSSMSFTPKQLAAEIKKHIPGFKIKYQPDERQLIADSWPASINDSEARADWAWQPKYDLASMTEDMILHLKKTL